MNAVFDTNVIAYYLLGTAPFSSEVTDCLGACEMLLAPALWEAELANVVWMSVRTGVLPAEKAPAKLALATRLGIQSVPVRALWQGALLRSIQSNVSVYDTLFIELADREGLALVTFDQKLLKAFPAVAKRPRQFRP